MPNTETPAGDAQAIIETARRAAEPIELDPDKAYAFATDRGIEVVRGAEYSGHPERKIGTVTVFDADSLLEYVLQQHDGTATRMWVDERQSNVVAVLNGHEESVTGAGFGDHRARLLLRKTASWQAWEEIDGKLVDQEQFAEFIEDHAIDLANPPAAIMLELAQSFKATTRVSFESTKFLANGQRALEYKETIDAKAGHKGELTIPAQIELGLRPFDRSDPYRVSARFRYRIGDGRLRIGVKLDQPAEVLRSAFRDVVEKVRDGIAASDTGIAILNGTPS